MSDNRSTDNWLIRGGLMFDGRGNPAERADVHVRDGRIVHIGPWQQGPAPAGARVLEAEDLLVTPGLIDLHVHAYTGRLWSVSPHEAGLRSGVTTFLDTGSAGAMTWETLESCVLPHARESAYALLNISLPGVWQGPPGHEAEIGGELCDVRWLRPDLALACIRQSPQRLIGTKARLTAILADGKVENERAALHGALQAARQSGGFCMVHHAASNLSHCEVLEALQPGDVYTHFYHPSHQQAFRSGRATLDAFFDARERGVVFDVGHGTGSFGWAQATLACHEHGLWPDTISTDLHRFNINGPVFDLPTTMSKLLHLGMPLPEVVRAVTSRAAETMKIEDRCGVLEVGREADITLLKWEDGAFALPDSCGETRIAPRRLAPVKVFKRGIAHDCCPVTLPDVATPAT